MPTSSKPQPVIQIQGLGKRYRIGASLASGGHGGAARLTGPVRRAWKRLGHRAEPPPSIWALRDLDLEVREGEVLGLVGANGAGKSTLLKLLALITQPTEGRFTLRGRVASLLEVGIGFHWELTGRENIYLAGTIFGMRRHEIDRRFDEIVEFADVGPFMDTPMKRFSSGMYMRLAFAVAAHLDSEILLLDEVLAVGDAAFRDRSLGTMRAAAEGGRTVIFVSHDMGAIQKLCTRAILLDGGRLVAEGHPQEVVSQYLKVEARSSYRARERKDGPQLLEAGLRAASGDVLVRPTASDPIGFQLRWAQRARKSVEAIEVSVLAKDGSPLFSTVSSEVAHRLPGMDGDYESSVLVPAGVLFPGEYLLGVALLDVTGRVLERREPALAFSVTPGLLRTGAARRGALRVACEWTLPEKP